MSLEINPDALLALTETCQVSGAEVKRLLRELPGTLRPAIKCLEALGHAAGTHHRAYVAAGRYTYETAKLQPPQDVDPVPLLFEPLRQAYRKSYSRARYGEEEA